LSLLTLAKNNYCFWLIIYKLNIYMSEKLRNHIKNFTVKQLKKEILLVKREFNVSALKRDQVEAVILSYPYHFKHLLNKRGDMKPKGVPLITTWKKPKNMKMESMNFTLPTTPKKKKPTGTPQKAVAAQLFSPEEIQKFFENLEQQQKLKKSPPIKKQIRKNIQHR